jgi:hypothetical protein
LESAPGFVFGFFDRCDKGFPGANLSRDYETLFTVIRDRMRNEKNFLYGEYKALNKLKFYFKNTNGIINLGIQ